MEAITRVITNFDGQFTEIEQKVVLTIPAGFEEVALRLYEKQATIRIVAVSGHLHAAGSTRTFQMLGTATLPTNFVKYIGTFLFGQNKTEVFIIEVTD